MGLTETDQLVTYNMCKNSVKLVRILVHWHLVKQRVGLGTSLPPTTGGLVWYGKQPLV